MRYEEISTYSTTAKTGRGSYILDAVCEDDEVQDGADKIEKYDNNLLTYICSYYKNLLLLIVKVA